LIESEVSSKEFRKNWARLIQKINVDNEARFGYLDSYWFCLMDASICWAAAEADTQFSIFA
jgi:hypothetical protein